MVDPERHAGRAVAPPAMQAPTPPTNWQVYSATFCFSAVWAEDSRSRVLQ